MSCRCRGRQQAKRLNTGFCCFDGCWEEFSEVMSERISPHANTHPTHSFSVMERAFGESDTGLWCQNPVSGSKPQERMHIKREKLKTKAPSEGKALKVEQVCHGSTQILIRCTSNKKELKGHQRRVRKKREKKGERPEINISSTWPLSLLPVTASIMKRYESREGGRNERDKKRTVK